MTWNPLLHIDVRFDITKCCTERLLSSIEGPPSRIARPSISRMVTALSAARLAARTAPNVSGKRMLSDISITRTGKPIIRSEGGRYVLDINGKLQNVANLFSSLGTRLEVRRRKCKMSDNANFRIGHTATVFGATGQLGRYIVNRLGT